MKNHTLLALLGFVFLVTFVAETKAQDMELPYHQIPEYPETYSPGNVVARMIDGLGYRFYWATEGLTPPDLAYRPSEDGRTTLETMQHICGMSFNILNAPTATPNERRDLTGLSYEELRQQTLENLKATSKAVAGKSADDMESFKIVFQRGDQQTILPYWNLINGMISDCIYHTGQIVLIRRASGNPQNPKVNVLMGKTGE
ncbi:DinB family protein [Flagellimonas iocasae]|uniref:DinB family protein n=1 Tax=Flagellimonas iocasae TaxID=2055905 RepID=A0ABW4XX35_9FLAO